MRNCCTLNRCLILIQDDTAAPEVPQLSWKILGEKDVKEMSVLSVHDVARYVPGDTTNLAYGYTDSGFQVLTFHSNQEYYYCESL